MNPLDSYFYNKIGKKIGRVSRILLETDNWYVIPTIGSLTAGYVLLVNKQHYLSLANVDRKSYLEMLDLKMSVESVLLRQLNMPCLIFEHGTPSPLLTGANSVEHVHIHILPFHRPIWSEIFSVMPRANFEIVNDYESLYTIWQNVPTNSYLLFQDIDRKIYYIPNARNMPSQLFRRCLAPHLGMKSWDWRSEDYLDNIIRTIEIFK